MERVWLIVAMLCMITAAIFLWRGQVDEAYARAAFVAGTLGVVAWFLRLRTQLQKTIPSPTDSAQEDEEKAEDQDEN